MAKVPLIQILTTHNKFGLLFDIFGDDARATANSHFTKTGGPISYHAWF